MDHAQDEVVHPLPRCRVRPVPDYLVAVMSYFGWATRLFPRTSAWPLPLVPTVAWDRTPSTPGIWVKVTYIFSLNPLTEDVFVYSMLPPATHHQPPAPASITATRPLLVSRIQQPQVRPRQHQGYTHPSYGQRGGSQARLFNPVRPQPRVHAWFEWFDQNQLGRTRIMGMRVGVGERVKCLVCVYFLWSCALSEALGIDVTVFRSREIRQTF